MKSQQTISYGVCLEESGSLAIDGPHYRTKREAIQELRQYHRHGHAGAFVVQSTLARMPTSPTKRRKAGAP